VKKKRKRGKKKEVLKGKNSMTTKGKGGKGEEEEEIKKELFHIFERFELWLEFIVLTKRGEKAEAETAS